MGLGGGKRFLSWSAGARRRDRPLSEPQESTNPSHGPGDRDQTHSQQQDMKATQEAEGAIRVSLDEGPEPAMEEQRLENEKYQGEDQPDWLRSATTRS